jgi:hypothetical protein
MPFLLNKASIKERASTNRSFYAVHLDRQHEILISDLY